MLHAQLLREECVYYNNSWLLHHLEQSEQTSLWRQSKHELKHNSVVETQDWYCASDCCYSEFLCVEWHTSVLLNTYWCWYILDSAWCPLFFFSRIVCETVCIIMKKNVIKTIIRYMVVMDNSCWIKHAALWKYLNFIGRKLKKESSKHTLMLAWQNSVWICF